MEESTNTKDKLTIPTTASRFFWTQLVMRLLGSGVCLAALVIMISTHQSVDFGGFVMVARYSYSSAFKFLAGVDGVVCGCSLLSLIYVSLLFGRSAKSHHDPSAYYFNLFLHDLGMTVLMMAGCGAGSAIGYVARYGQSQSGWSPICDELGRFCNNITASVVLSYIVLIFYLSLTVFAVLKIKSHSTEVALTQEAPPAPPNDHPILSKNFN